MSDAYGSITQADTDPGVPTIKTPEEAKKLPEGSHYYRDGQKFQIPYRPKNPSEAENLPEGSMYVTPDGQTMKVPKYEGLDFTSQTLYNMAVTDKEREKALERSYPGKVKKNKTGFYVDDDGTLRRSKGFTEAPGSFMASQAAPVLGSIAGEVAGGVGGSPLGPPGVFGGAVAGGAAGGAAGQAFNDSIMALAGVYDRSPGEEASELGMSGAFGGGGTAVGRGLAAVAPTIKGAIKTSLPKIASNFLGAGEGDLATGIGLREKGVLVPPSPMFPEAPHLANVIEKFDPAMRTQNPLLQSATEHYEKSGSEILKGKDIGVQDLDSLVSPKAAVSTEKAGEAILGRTRDELRQADETLRQHLLDRQTQVASTAVQKTTEQQSHMAALESAASEARAKAQAVIDEGFKHIAQTSDAAMEATKSGHNSGDLWQRVANEIKSVRAGFMARANKMYGEADHLAGGLKPDISGLSERAQSFLEQLPEGFEGRYPTVVKQIRDLAGVRNVDKEGNIIEGFKKPPVEPTWAQLHQLRSVLRSNYNRLDLTPDVKQGTYKFFASKVDDILNDENARPELKAAAKQLREADDFYKTNMGVFNDRRLQAVMDGLDAGLPADPKVLFDTVVKEGRSDLTKKIAEMVGPNLWAGVKSADVREMLDQSKALNGQIDGKRFVSQVLDRYRSGMLEAVHGKDVSAQLLRQAQNIEALAGRLDIPVRPGDKIADVINKARVAADAAKQAAAKDPLGELTKEMRGITRQLDNSNRLAAKNLKLASPNSKLGFLYDPTVGAAEAVEKILGHEDMIIAAASKFGQNSPEFNLLRQVWAQKILTGTLEPSSRLSKVSEEVQKIMFPGASMDQMKTLAKEMDFLMSGKSSSDTGTSFAATGKVEHPLSQLPNIFGIETGKVINVATLGLGDPAARFVLGKYYKMVTSLVNNPAFLRWVEKGLKGNDQARAMVKAEVQKRMNLGGAIGAGVGESQYSTPNQNLVFGQ